MKKSKDEMIDEIITSIKKMCEKNDMTEEEIQKRLIQARETNDYILLALLTAAQVFSLHRES